MSLPSIIVVGPDGVGKTTLVQGLSKALDIPSFKCPSEKEIFRTGGRSSLAFDYTMTHFLEQTGFRFVSDRGYPCEWVYSSVFERETDMDLLGLIDTQHAMLGTRILYLYSSVIPFEEDDIVPMDRYADIRDAYDNFVDWTKCQVTAMDTAEMLTDFHVHGRDTSGLFATQTIERMGLGVSHVWGADGNWYSCIYCHLGAGDFSSPEMRCCQRRKSMSLQTKHVHRWSPNGSNMRCVECEIEAHMGSAVFQGGKP